MRRFVLLLAAGVLAPSVASAADPPAGVADALKAIKAVGPEGAGSEAAAKGWKSLAKSGASALVPTLTAFDDASPVAANWLRSAVNAIVEGEEKAGRVISTTDLGRFAADTRRNPAARRLAFELLARRDKATADAMLPDFLNDPSPELRRDAVAARFKEMEPWANVDNLKKGLGELFRAARDKDQVEAIAKRLKEFGVAVNTTKHFGYITEWNLSNEYENKEEKGFATAHPPESQPDRKEWKHYQTWDPYGTIDLNKAIAEKKDVLAYASAVIVAEEETKCQVRCASQNAIKVFVNGKEVFGKDEYHHGEHMDQHVANVTLKKGKNELLVKVMQNNMPYEWTKVWQFSARVCDPTGAALPVHQVVTKDGQETTIELGELAPAPPKKEKEEKK